MDNLPTIGSLGPPQNTNLPWVRWAEIDAANDNSRSRNIAWKIYLVYLREGSSWEAGSHQEMRHYFLVARAYRQARVAWSSPSATQLYRAANLCEENWTVALGHFLIAQYPTHERLLFWASNRRVYPAVHEGVRKPRTDETINRTSGPGPRTADGTDDLVSLSGSLGVESYYSGIPLWMVLRVDVSENPSQHLAPMDDDGTDGGSHESGSGKPEPEPETELEDEGQRPLVATLHPDVQSRQTISELIHTVKGDVEKLSHELLVHRRAAANRRADIRDDVTRLRGDADNFRKNTQDTLESITERVTLVEQSVAGLCQNRNSRSLSNLQEGNPGDTAPIPSHAEMYAMISGIKENIATLLAADRAPNPIVAQIQRSLNTAQGYFEQCLKEMEKDIGDLKMKDVANTLTINNLKRQIITQSQINETMMETLHSMEERLGQPSSRTQLRALNARLEIRRGE
ncbi:unnamed protein product [Clonostachys byssicola]|uniref:Uncharacterized protein n=1 Tax=Clonostachys byssicola TaxID=160290 RepID=A0A9N9TWB2_9HYPO|nr:unnamed protein product [Clonostachys byssicola]